MTTVSIYNHTLQKFTAKGVDGVTLKFMLLNNSAVFNAAHTQLSQVTNSGAYQVSGNGWPAGGVTITGLAAVLVTTNDAILTGNNISQAASGGIIGPAYKGVIYDDLDANDAPYLFYDFEGAKQADAGTNFQINMSADGLLKFNA